MYLIQLSPTGMSLKSMSSFLCAGPSLRRLFPYLPRGTAASDVLTPATAAGGGQPRYWTRRCPWYCCQRVGDSVASLLRLAAGQLSLRRRLSVFSSQRRGGDLLARRGVQGACVLEQPRKAAAVVAGSRGRWWYHSPSSNLLWKAVKCMCGCERFEVMQSTIRSVLSKNDLMARGPAWDVLIE